MNILIHAMMYPESETEKRANTTLFISEYAERWAEAGHNVLVWHHKMSYPAIFERVARLAARVLPMKKLRAFLYGYGADENREFTREGVRVIRSNLPRIVPHSLISDRAARKRADMIDFEPDIVICDFLCPCLPIALAMKSRVRAPIAVALHYSCSVYLNKFYTRRRARALLKQADMVMFRSEAARRELASWGLEPFRSEIMPSGIPARFMADSVAPRTRVGRFIIVSRLIERKFIDRAARAFLRLGAPGTELVIIGDGPERPAVEKIAAEAKGKITLLGEVPRERVFQELERADAFMLPSKNETFGMAYIEAMSRGLLTIGALGEGADGIIKDGENGFLLPAGDEDALYNKLRELINMDAAEISRISSAARETASRMTDAQLARDALEKIAAIPRPASILMVSRGYPTAKNTGYQVFVKRLAEAFAEAGAKVSVISPVALHQKRALGAEDEHGRVTVLRPARLTGLWYPLTAFLFERSVMSCAARHGLAPDVVYAHFSVPSGTAAAKLAKKLSVPMFFAYGESTPKLVHKYGLARARRSLAYASGMVAVSEAAREAALELGLISPEAARVFPNGVTSDFKRLDKAACREKFGFSQDDFIFAFTGAFTGRKGARRLSQAAERVPGAKIICAGAGEEPPQGASVLFAGSVPAADMPEFLNCADAFVLPTLNEGLSNAILEAMACGLPIISSDRDFNKTILDSRNAILVEPEDIDAIARAMRELMEDSQRRAQMGQENARRAENYRLENRARAILEFINERSI